MNLHRVIYTSRPFGFDETILDGILMDARRLNARNGITGALICRQNIYMQLLEGPEAPVRNTVERIGRDDRHIEMKVHLTEPASERMFGDWAMLHDPAVSWIWSREAVDNGVVDNATAEEVEGFFVKLRHKREMAPSDL
ncbi:BLUF domain-containing protein [Acuticoccus sp. MNP-M23]|uniref:BLUF domain-containing protein n=1 Tax=Acuticoccus sp. MNP-M23 TaxID=3072793 RepID=UPI002814E461|nr:BLUF domain-containing protein [Acuticoccus sp. MNP-M23]WMS44562.1 BLUF domain-containing protein [Acuticoccus sp. MNP-M23]